jgi:hypothetical protein
MQTSANKKARRILSKKCDGLRITETGLLSHVPRVESTALA